MKKLLILFLCFPFLMQAQAPHIIPAPLSMALKNGYFLIDDNVSIKANFDDKATADIIHFFTTYVQQVTGFSLSATGVKSKFIEFKIEKTSEIGEEGYTLSVTPNSILIKANTAKGLFYEFLTFSQNLCFL